MTIKEELKKRLNNYSKEELLDALLQSGAATAFVIEKCKALYGVKDAPVKKPAKNKDKDADAGTANTEALNNGK